MTNRPTEIFTDGELHRALELYRATGPRVFWQRCTAEIIEPLLPLLDERLGYEGDPAILSYMLLELFVAADKSFMAP